MDPASTLAPASRPPTHSDQSSHPLQMALGSLLAFLALSAFVGGIYGMLGAPGVPESSLVGSPFRSVFLLGLFLFVVVGSALSMAAVVVFRHHRFAHHAAMLAATLLLCWIAIEVAIIEFRSWVQPVAAVCALLILVLAEAMPTEPVAPRSSSRARLS